MRRMAPRNEKVDRLGHLQRPQPARELEGNPRANTMPEKCEWSIKDRMQDLGQHTDEFHHTGKGCVCKAAFTSRQLNCTELHFRRQAGVPTSKGRC